MTANVREHRIAARDGLKLYVRDSAPDAGGTPVVCLPGLTRNHRDFSDFAARLAPARRVVSIDMRGRGLSGHDPDWTHYTVPQEIEDILAVLSDLQIGRAVFLGTSRGGIQTMVLAATQKDLVAGAILNDIGPVLDMRGLTRIGGYVTAKTFFSSWEEAISALKQSDASQIANLDDAGWEAYARRLFVESDGKIANEYDPGLGRAFARDMENAGAADLWPLFDALGTSPLLILRGENSDLFAPETAQEMARRHPDAELVTVKDRGHVPFLDEPECVASIDRFLARIP